jgi:protein-tyrosine phosphatase
MPARSIDPSVAALLQRDQVLSLADDRKYLLLELPLDVPVNPVRLISQLADQGVRTIIAHAERYPSVVRQPSQAMTWVQSGAAIQVNAGSLIGEAGGAVETCAWELLRRGLVSIVASDAHDPIRRKPRIAEAASMLADEIGATPARQLLAENPQRVLSGQPLMPVIAFVDGRAF